MWSHGHRVLVRSMNFCTHDDDAEKNDCIKVQNAYVTRWVVSLLPEEMIVRCELD